MPHIAVDDGTLTIRLSPVEKLLALRGDVHADARLVRSAAVVGNPWRLIRGLRMPGTAFPGILAVGTWRWREGESRGRDFVAVRRGLPGVSVELGDHVYSRLLVSIEHPERIACELNNLRPAG